MKILVLFEESNGKDVMETQWHETKKHLSGWVGQLNPSFQENASQ